MRFFTSILATFTLVSVVSAATFLVEVGANNANTFTPPFLSGVQSGDLISFRFLSKNHTVTQSTFDKPCERKDAGVHSGFQAVNATSGFPEWTIKIDNVTTPHWFYCAQAPHCTAAGMVFAINPTQERSFERFQNIAKGLETPAGTAAGGSSSGTGTGASPAATSTAGAGDAGAGNAGANPPPASGAIDLSVPQLRATAFAAIVGSIVALAL